jgi:hypothetical protein
LTLGTDGIRLDPQPSLHCSTTHLHAASIGRYDKPVGRCWVDADKHPALPAGSHRHVSRNEEGKAAEHLLLGHARFAHQQLAYSICEVLVIGHDAIVDTGRTDDALSFVGRRQATELKSKPRSLKITWAGILSGRLWRRQAGLPAGAA